MRKAKVLYKDEWAGTLSQMDNGSFEFSYKESWIINDSKPPVSLTLPKQEAPLTSTCLFPFFYNMLPEGSNKDVVCYNLRIDKNDHFGILMATAKSDTIGAVRIENIEEL